MRFFALLAIFSPVGWSQSWTFGDGIVTVSVSKSGDLSITGDNANNSFHCQIVGANFRFNGFGGTKLVGKLGNMTTAPASALNIPLVELPFVRHLSIDLKQGENSVLILNLPSVIHGNFTARLGKGRNFLDIDSSNSVEIKGKLKISGASNSEAHFVYINGDVLIGGSLAVSLKSAHSEVELYGFEVVKSLTVSLSGLSSNQFYRLLPVGGATKILSRAMNSEI